MAKVIIKAKKKMPVFFNPEEARRGRRNKRYIEYDNVVSRVSSLLSYYYCCFLREGKTPDS